MVTPAQALSALDALADTGAARRAADYHTAPSDSGRQYLGLTPAQIDAHVVGWRSDLSVDGRVALASALWDSNVHEAKVAAAKLLTQARMRPDANAWALICAWVPGLDVWALADLVTTAGQKRVMADPARIEDMEDWLESPNLWTRRAALQMLLPWAKMNNLKDAEYDIRETGLIWAEHLVPDREWFIQKAIADWIDTLAKHDAPRAVEFMDGPGLGLKGFARREAARRLPRIPLPEDDLPEDRLPADDLPEDDLPADDLPADDLPADDAPQADAPEADTPEPDAGSPKAD
jgi:3-methyladenine DNA glycosylase AlkD